MRSVDKNLMKFNKGSAKSCHWGGIIPLHAGGWLATKWLCRKRPGVQMVSKVNMSCNKVSLQPRRPRTSWDAWEGAGQEWWSFISQWWRDTAGVQDLVGILEGFQWRTTRIVMRRHIIQGEAERSGTVWLGEEEAQGILAICIIGEVKKMDTVLGNLLWLILLWERGLD